MHTFPSEKRQFTAPHTGRTVTQWTDSPARDNHLYFTSPSVTADDRWLVFLSERLGDVNFFAIDRLGNGAIQQLTDNRRGTMRSYCWPRGSAYGICKAAPCLDAQRNRLYYLRDEALWRIDLDDIAAGPVHIWDMPTRWWAAFTHVSPDGKRMCIPLTPPQVMLPDLGSQREQMDTIPHAFRVTGRRCRMYEIDLETGAERILAELPFWVTHVQYNPHNSEQLIFNCEGCWNVDLPRIWCLHGPDNFAPIDNNREEARTHENWVPNGEFIVYHGNRQGVPFFAGRRFDGSEVFHQPVPDFNHGHITPTVEGHGFLSDGVDASVTLFVMQSDGSFQRTTLCDHGLPNHDHCEQDDHVHPLIAPHGRSVVFTGSHTGVANVCETDIADLV